MLRHIDEGRLESDLGYRFGYLAEFMGFGPDDSTSVLRVYESVLGRKVRP